MISYMVRRLLEAIPIIVLIVVVNFVILHIAPGDPVFFFIQGGTGATEEYVEQVRHWLGLDKSLGTQLLLFLSNVFRGDLGFSHFYQRPVVGIIAERIPITFLLVFLAITLAASIGVTLGMLAAKFPYSVIDRMTTLVAVFGYSIPIFWFGQMLILVFAVHLRVLPTGGIPIHALGESSLANWIRHLILPTISLGVLQLALVARVTRAAALEILGMEYITAARAKGVRESVVLFKHTLRNVMLPVVTIVGVNLGFLLTGAMIIETVFSWPGLGRMMFESIFRRDYPVLMGLLILMSVGVVLVNLVTDLAYAYLDPRVAYD